MTDDIDWTIEDEKRKQEIEQRIETRLTELPRGSPITFTEPDIEKIQEHIQQELGQAYDIDIEVNGPHATIKVAPPKPPSITIVPDEEDREKEDPT